MKDTEGYMYAGSNLLSKGGSDHDIVSYKIHEKYNPSLNWINDVCLVKVKQPFEFGPKVQQVTLPLQGWKVYDQDSVSVTGWGYIDPVRESINFNDDEQLIIIIIIICLFKNF